MRCRLPQSPLTFAESSSASDPIERAADVVFGTALQAMTVRDDEIIEIPPENSFDAPPHRRLVPHAELDVQRGAAVPAPDTRHTLYAAPYPRFAGGVMLLDEIGDDERLGGFV